jgi:hypothetical protein
MQTSVVEVELAQLPNVISMVMSANYSGHTSMPPWFVLCEYVKDSQVCSTCIEWIIISKTAEQGQVLRMLVKDCWSMAHNDDSKLWRSLSLGSLLCDWCIATSTASSPIECRLVSSFNFQYPVLSLKFSSRCLCLLPRNSFLSIFPSVTCSRRQYSRKM